MEKDQLVFDCDFIKQHGNMLQQNIAETWLMELENLGDEESIKWYWLVGKIAGMSESIANENFEIF